MAPKGNDCRRFLLGCRQDFLQNLKQISSAVYAYIFNSFFVSALKSNTNTVVRRISPIKNVYVFLFINVHTEIKTENLQKFLPKTY